jgi:hypothetical protein
MERDPVLRAEKEEVKRRIAGDALGYSKLDGPYTGQNLSDYEVYEASEIDFDNASDNYDEVATREYNGIKRTEFDDGSVFIDTGNGVINVTGHPGHDPNHEDYYGPPVDEED